MSMLSKALGGGGSIPGIDAAKLNAINQKNAQTQRELIAQRLSGLQPINAQFETSRNALSARIPGEAEKVIGQYGADLDKATAAEKSARDTSTNQFREQAFRDVPAVQQAIRNQLSGNRLMGSGAALSSLAKPLIGATQNASDFAAQNESARLGNVANRADSLASGGFGVRQKAMADRLGLDQSTIDSLAQMGRTDIIDKFNSLAGVEDQAGANELSIEQAKQQNDIARAQADAAKRGGLFSQVGQLGGAAIGGMFGGAPGAAAGMSLGGSLGGMVGGNTNQQFDPTMLFALSNRNKSAISKSLSGGRSTPTISNYSSMVG
jgi:hypothetical protein